MDEVVGGGTVHRQTRTGGRQIADLTPRGVVVADRPLGRNQGKVGAIAFDLPTNVVRWKLWIEADDFMETPPPKYFRLRPGGEVRLKPLAEYRTLFEEPGRFLMIPSMEVTSAWKRPKTATTPEQTGPVHMNLTNPRTLVAPVAADNAVEIMQRSVEAVRAQREATGQPMFIHLNHPNFVWGITAEELMQVHHEKFFEVYNGHPGVHNAGDAAHLSNEEIWDVVLTRRLAELKLDVMYGIGVDDSHNYHEQMLGKSNSGRGWVMVRACHLTPESIILAMEAGDFYATSGVTLKDVTRTATTLALEIQTEPGVTYVTQFIGTRRGYDPASQLLPAREGDAAAAKTLPHRRYSKDVGAVLAEVKGATASYTLQGDELYVRARVISSKAKVNGSVADEFETAWTQPVVGAEKP